MGEENDGSSIAAQSAQDKKSPDTQAPDGVFKRLLATLMGTTSEARKGASDDVNGVAVPKKIGLGNLDVKRVEDVATPRAEIISVPVTIELDELVKVFRESGLTRLPLFEETLDTPVGMIHLKDLSLKHGFNGQKSDFTLRDMARPVLFVPPSMPIGVLLQKMQSERTHMALVIDEYGGVDGLVTIEDLIEQVLGEIEDEHDVDEDALWLQERAGSYLVQARAPLADFEEQSGIRLSDDEMDEEVDTLGGLVFMLSGRVPTRGEVVKHPSGAEFEIVDADPRRIKRLRVLLPSEGGRT
ncbi:hemolysin family protein [Litoreibacter roseus]|uniref:Conjugation transfer protein n=1 Tax=Litoreibacter roseus TaxID=2601869 RepID=A0A6N6JA01_9RHOB|nr:hemolysin family protein [Litoreibacter roseus]GFE63081.1 conjugation transfer protein [Litoreibacter roseus]